MTITQRKDQVKDSYWEERQKIRGRKSEFDNLLKIYIGLGNLLDLKRVDRDEPRNYINELLELQGIDDIDVWDYYLNHQGTWEEFEEHYCS